MSALTNYGEAIAATTLAIQELFSAPPVGLQVTSRAPHSTRVGLSGPSLNVFLYSDGLISYREETVHHGQTRMIAELHYLVTAYPGDDADTDAASHRAYGSARAAIERHPVIPVPVGPGRHDAGVADADADDGGGDVRGLAGVRLPLQLSFSMMAAFTLDASEGPVMVGSIRDVVSAAGPGKLAAFSGPDDAEKRRRSGVGCPGARKASPRGAAAATSSVPISRRRRAASAKLFAQPRERRRVLVVTDADSLFGVRPEALDIRDPYADVNVAEVLELFTRAPGPVIIAVTESLGPELADRAAVEVRFPAELHQPSQEAEPEFPPERPA